MAQKILINGNANKGETIIKNIDIKDEKTLVIKPFLSIDTDVPVTNISNNKIIRFYKKAMRKICRKSLEKEIAKVVSGGGSEKRVIELVRKIAIYTAQIEGVVGND